MAPLRIIFFGTAELACASLEALVADPQFLVAAVVTQPDRPKGRSLQMQPSAVKTVAQRLGLPVLQPERARHPDFLAELLAVAPDLITVAAYGQILPQSILDLPRHGCLNVHTSLLPKYRGAAPIQWAIFDGEPETGVTIMKMDAGLDTGAILTQSRTAILPGDNGQTLTDRLAKMGAELLIATIPEFVSGKLQPCAQPSEGASYARKIEKSDGLIVWDKSARALFNQIRSFAPWPGSFTYLNEPRRQLLKIWVADIAPQSGSESGTVLAASKDGLIVACGSEALRITESQIEGGKRLPIAQFLAGRPIAVGTKLG